MLLYDIRIHDLKTDIETTVITLVERRSDPARPADRNTVEKWARSILGEDWWLQNWHNIVIKREYFRNEEQRRRDPREVVQQP